jgi:hypothetical protein
MNNHPCAEMYTLYIRHTRMTYIYTYIAIAVYTTTLLVYYNIIVTSVFKITQIWYEWNYNTIYCGNTFNIFETLENRIGYKNDNMFTTLL